MIFLKKLKKRNLIFDFIGTHTHESKRYARMLYTRATSMQEHTKVLMDQKALP